MQDVHLVHLHEVEGVEEDALGKEVPARVDHDAAVREARVVQDLGAVHLVLKMKRQFHFVNANSAALANRLRA